MGREDIISKSKEQLKMLLPGFIHLFSIISLLILLKPEGYLELIIAITLINVVKESQNIYEFKKFIVSIIKSTASVSLLYYIMFVSLSYGAIGFALYILVLSLWTMFGSKNKRGNFMQGLRNIESSLFGKPLDKSEWMDEKPSINIKLKR